jgi:arabinogalactan endo-1,4-beta-galactosidase
MKPLIGRKRHLTLISTLVIMTAALWLASASAQAQDATIQENTLGFCGVQGTVDSNHSGFTGSGFANADNATGSGIDWSVDATASGVYQLEWRFANGSTARPGSVKINGASVTTVSFPSTGVWNSWTTISTTVSLIAGRNSIRLEATTSGGLANIDSLAVTGGSGVQAADCNGGTTEILIEENTIGFCRVDGSIASNHAGYTGGGFADTNNATSAGVDWKVSVPASGNYALAWRYANGSTNNRPGSVRVNGSSVATVNFPATGAWTTWAVVSSANIALSAGENTIRLQATTSEGLGNIDSLSVTGNSPQPVQCSGGGIFRPPYMLGADITWTLEQESINRRYSDNGQTKSIERILVDHGFNYVRLRTFVCPQCDGGYLDNLYSGAGPTENWADTAHTIEMAQRVKTCGMGVFLNFHLSDNWASIGHQERPSQWQGMSDAQIRTASYNYSKGVLDQMVAAGVKPDMVQCGNENNTHVAGYSYNNWAGFSGVINSCLRAVRETDPNIITVLQHGRPRPDGDFPFWLNRVFSSNPPIDADVVCGSTYGTTNNGGDWWDMFNLVINDWNKPVLSCEYTNDRRDLVNNTFRSLPNGMGWGTFIWEPTAFGDSRPFNFSNGVYSTNSAMDEYARIAREANLPVPSKPASQLEGTTCQ